MEKSGNFPRCPHCQRLFEPGTTWKGANYCRGLFLLKVIGEYPGLSAWELSQKAKMAYGDTTRGLLKLRDFDLLTFEAEERDGGGQRYRYWSNGESAPIHRFMAALARATEGY